MENRLGEVGVPLKCINSLFNPIKSDKLSQENITITNYTLNLVGLIRMLP